MTAALSALLASAEAMPRSRMALPSPVVAALVRVAMAAETEAAARTVLPQFDDALDALNAALAP